MPLHISNYLKNLIDFLDPGTNHIITRVMLGIQTMKSMHISFQFLREAQHMPKRRDASMWRSMNIISELNSLEILAELSNITEWPLS